MKVVAKRRVQRILKNVRKFSCNFRESRESVARRRAAQRMRRNVESFEVFPARFNGLKHADVFPQALQVLRGFREEHLYGCRVERASNRPSATTSGFCSSSAVGS